MTRRSRLLFLCQALPYPPDEGAKIRSYHTLRALAATYDVTALCFHRAKIAAETDDLRQRCEALKPYARVHAYPIPQEHSRWRLCWDHLRSLTRSRVYTAYVYASMAFRDTLREELGKGDISLVHVDSLDLCGYLPWVRDVPVVCGHHNHESLLLRRRALLESSRLRAAYLTHQANLMEREERRWCPRVDLNVVVSDDDRRSLSETAPGARFLIVPNGVDTDVFRPAEDPDPDERGLVFVGGTTWFPNRDALRFFAEQIQPLMPRGTVRRVEWVGRCTSEERQLFAERHAITLTGYVEDIRPFVCRAACYIVPLRVGGGTRVKILEAWAMGKAVVSTSVGCEGLAAEDGVNILVRDDPASFASAISDVVRNPALRAHLGRNARATAERLYARETLAGELVERYAELVADWADRNGTSAPRGHRPDGRAE